MYASKVFGIPSKINLVLVFLLYLFFFGFIAFAELRQNPEKLSQIYTHLYSNYGDKAIIIIILYLIYRINLILIFIFLLFAYFYYPKYCNNIIGLKSFEIGNNKAGGNEINEKIEKSLNYLITKNDIKNINIKYFISDKSEYLVLSPLAVKLKSGYHCIIFSRTFCNKVKEVLIKENELDSMLAHEIGHILNRDGRLFTAIRSLFKTRVVGLFFANIAIFNIATVLLLSIFNSIDTPNISLVKKVIYILDSFPHYYNIFLSTKHLGLILITIIILFLAEYQIELRELLADAQASYLVESKNGFINTVKKYEINKRLRKRRIKYFKNDILIASESLFKTKPIIDYFITAIMFLLAIILILVFLDINNLYQYYYSYIIYHYLFNILLLVLNNVELFSYVSKSKIKGLASGFLTFGMRGNTIKPLEVMKIYLKNIVIIFPISLIVQLWISTHQIISEF